MILPVWLWLVLAASALCGDRPWCSCRIPSAEVRYEEAAAVFRGVVLEVGERPSSASGEWRVPVTLRVTHRWKGAAADTLVVGDHPGCSVVFEPGQEYLVYADRGENGKLETSFCERSRPLVHAAEDVRALDGLAGGTRH